MRFVPLAMSKMREHGTCVAGVNLDGGEWIRPIVSGAPCLFDEQTAQFEANHVHDLRIGGVSASSQQEGVYHTEDRIFNCVISVGEKLTPQSKLELLKSFTDGSLASSLFAGSRSIFLIEPEDFTYGLDQYNRTPRFHLSGFPPAPKWAASLEERQIGISKTGIPCTCPRWSLFSQQTWPGKDVTLSMIQDYTAGANVFLAMSLGRLYHDRHWVMVAGVHIVGDDEIWL